MDLVDIREVPVHCNVLLPTREAALAAPRGAISLEFCTECAHVFNADFDPAPMSYTQAYENSLHFSPRFQAYAEELADSLITRYGLSGKSLIDIGCGKGDFLALMCERGDNRGYGFDPSYVPDQVGEAASQRMTIVQDFYTERYAGTAADFVMCRQVLEHIKTPVEFVRNVRSAVGERERTVVFFEVPNVLYTLKDLGIWDLIYEHCSYFTPVSLDTVFRRSGFTILALSELFGGQYLGIEMRPGQSLADPRQEERVAELLPYAHRFRDSYREKVAHWQSYLRQARAKGKRVLVWGGGSKGVTFLNVLPSDQVGGMVDINPRKQGMFVPGTGHRVVRPEFVREYQPDTVIIMNAIYEEEIRKTLWSFGVTPTLLSA
jgi:SAM-dependent methyltransferase